MNNLRTVADAIRLSAERKEAERIEHNNELNTKTIAAWLPDPENNGHGIGWFHFGDNFVAYRKYSTGWALHPVARMSVELVKQLHKCL